MRNIVWKIVLIFVAIAICTIAIIPPEERIRLGKDLRGGVSLVYAVRMEDERNWQSVMEQVVTVLKNRINPQGVLDISVTALGRDRIEIVMPLPSPEVQALKADYSLLLDQTHVKVFLPRTELLNALRAGNAVERFGGAAGTSRHVEITDLQQKYLTLQQAREALAKTIEEIATDPDATPIERKWQQESAVAAAESDYESTRDRILTQNVEKPELIRVLALSQEPQKRLDLTGKPLIDPGTKQPLIGPSPRANALTDLKTRFAFAAEDFDRLTAAYDEFNRKRKGLDDPDDLMRLLRGAGVLEFQIAVSPTSAEGVSIEDMRRQLAERGPENTDSTVARWYPVNDLTQWYDRPDQLASLMADPQSYFAQRNVVAAERDGMYFLLIYTTEQKAMNHVAGKSWSLEATFITQDQLGRPAVGFRLDNAGGLLMRRMTTPNVGQPMAILLDRQVYSAPNLNEGIGSSGIISGNFSEKELSYLQRVLAAGALEARLSPQPLSVSVLGPSLGMDNLSLGLKACAFSIAVTCVMMLGYYFFAGFIANIALLVNALMTFGLMALIDGTFTLPGLAGIALSIAMAVDANVLIYERIREELVNNKEDLRTAIRLGYQRALSAIIDGNVTNLIVCVVLYYTATTEVKGFALTLSLGIFATLFTALFVTRVIYAFYTDFFGFKTLNMLPIAVPKIRELLTPSINWIGLQKYFAVGSLIVVVVGMVLFWQRGKEMLDTEFRGGVSMAMETRFATDAEKADGLADAGGRLLLDRAEVERQVRLIGEEAAADEPVLQQFRNAAVLTQGETKGLKSSGFQVKVANAPTVSDEATITETAVAAIVKQFGSLLDVTPPLTFEGAVSGDRVGRTFPIEESNLGANIGRPDVDDDVTDYVGGVVVLIREIDPPIATDDAARRIERMRNQPDFVRNIGRQVRVIGLDPADPQDASAGYRTLAVAVYDEDASLTKVDVETWDARLAAPEWTLVSQALSRPAALQQVNSFSAAVAATLAANAVVAVVMSLIGMLVYIWARFGSLRYSMGAIIALTFNVLVTLGALALTHHVAETVWGSSLLIEAFRIDLNVVAALLTIIGYSLNDTIVILDRIRENRGKLPLATAEIINNSINQTFSRTVLTGGSTVMAAVILYVLGGTGIRPFAFTFLIGLLVGTYSSVAIAAPFTLSRKSAITEETGKAAVRARRGPKDLLLEEPPTT